MLRNYKNKTCLTSCHANDIVKEIFATRHTSSLPIARAFGQEYKDVEMDTVHLSLFRLMSFRLQFVLYNLKSLQKGREEPPEPVNRSRWSESAGPGTVVAAGGKMNSRADLGDRGASVEESTLTRLPTANPRELGAVAACAGVSFGAVFVFFAGSACGAGAAVASAVDVGLVPVLLFVLAASPTTDAVVTESAGAFRGCEAFVAFFSWLGRAGAVHTSEAIVAVCVRAAGGAFLFVT